MHLTEHYNLLNEQYNANSNAHKLVHLTVHPAARSCRFPGPTPYRNPPVTLCLPSPSSGTAWACCPRRCTASRRLGRPRAWSSG